MRRLGFIGLGRMGTPMALRLLEAGHPLAVHDRNPDAMSTFAAKGAASAQSPAHAAASAHIILLCLPTPDVVQSVVLGADGLATGEPGRIVIDLGTTGPVMTRHVAAAAAERGLTMVDAPVTGGIAGAQSGTLTVMVSCAGATYEEIAGILAILGRVVYVGAKPGLAQTAKLANNLLSAAALAVSSEAMAMGVKAGIDPRVLLDIFNAGSGRNSATEDKFPRAILPGTFDFGMKMGLFLKDVRLCLDEAESLGVPMIAGSAVRQMFAAARARFGDDADFTRVAELVEEWARVKIRGESAKVEESGKVEK